MQFQVLPYQDTKDLQPNLTRRFLIPMRHISQSYRQKLSTRFHELDRLYICQKSKQQREEMGLEYEEIRLVEVYSKTDQNQKKIVQRYGQ